MGLRAFRSPTPAGSSARTGSSACSRARRGPGAVFTAVVGPSGSGKSSAVQAGLIPRLRRDRRRAAHRARCSRASQPFAELEAALDRLRRRPGGPSIARLRAPRAASSTRLHGCSDDARTTAPRRRPVRGAVHPRRSPRSPRPSSAPPAGGRGSGQARARARHDAGRLLRPAARRSRLGGLFADNVVNVIPLGPDELEAAATLPARQLDVVVEPRLVGRLIVDVAGPAERPPPLPVRAHRALRRAVGAGARPRHATSGSAASARPWPAGRSRSTPTSTAAEQEAVASAVPADRHRVG